MRDRTEVAATVFAIALGLTVVWRVIDLDDARDNGIRIGRRQMADELRQRDAGACITRIRMMRESERLRFWELEGCVRHAESLDQAYACLADREAAYAEESP